MASFRLLPVLALVAITCLLSSALSVAAVPSSAAAPYVEGLDALNEGHWPEAATAFTRALDKAGDNPDLVLAHGVASVLAEDFSRALKDLERATRLGYRGREPELWTYVTEAMSGLVAVPDHVLGGARGVPSGPVVVSIPGHIVQGHDDYTTEYGSFLVYRLGMEYRSIACRRLRRVQPAPPRSADTPSDAEGRPAICGEELPPTGTCLDQRHARKTGLGGQFNPRQRDSRRAGARGQPRQS